jgi:hypothetical protein
VQDADITDGNTFLDKVKVDLDIFYTLVLNMVGGEVDGADVVTVDESAFWQWSMKLLEELLESISFSTPLVTTRYSASALDREMIFWRLED